MSFASLEPNCPGAENVPFVVRLVADWLASTVYDVEGMTNWCKCIRAGHVTREFTQSMRDHIPPHIAANVRLMRTMSLCCTYFWHALRPGVIEVWLAATRYFPLSGYMNISDTVMSRLASQSVNMQQNAAFGQALAGWKRIYRYEDNSILMVPTNINKSLHQYSFHNLYPCYLLARYHTKDNNILVQAVQLSPLQLLEIERALVAHGFTITSKGLGKFCES